MKWKYLHILLTVSVTVNSSQGFLNKKINQQEFNVDICYSFIVEG